MKKTAITWAVYGGIASSVVLAGASVILNPDDIGRKCILLAGLILYGILLAVLTTLMIAEIK